MSDEQLTTARVRGGYVHHARVVTRSRANEAKPRFDAWLAEVECKAAEKAWDACDDAITAILVREGELSATVFNAWPANPYGAALGLTAEQEVETDGSSK